MLKSMEPYSHRLEQQATLKSVKDIENWINTSLQLCIAENMKGISENIPREEEVAPLFTFEIDRVTLSKHAVSN